MLGSRGRGDQIDNFVFEGGGRVQGINLEHFDYQRNFTSKAYLLYFNKYQVEKIYPIVSALVLIFLQ